MDFIPAMNPNRFLALALFAWLAAAPAGEARAQWVEANGGGGTRVYSLARMDTTVFAGTDQGIVASIDSGRTWQVDGPAGTGLEGFVNPIWISGNEIFAGTNGNAVYCSTDEGFKWNRLDSAQYQYAYNVSFGTKLFAPKYNGVYCSTDSGLNWFAAGLKDTAVSTLVISDTNIIAATPYGVYISTDSGLSWASTDLSNGNVGIFEIAESNLFAGTFETNPQIFRSTDNGKSWIEADSGLYFGSQPPGIYSLAVIDTTIFVATDDGVFASTDTGQYWASCNYLTGGPIQSLTVIGRSLIAASFGFTNLGGEIFRSVDNGVSWATVYNAFPNDGRSESPLAVEDSVLFASTDEGLLLTTNDGETWQVRTNGGALYVSDSNLFAANYDGIFKSTDEGLTWKNLGFDSIGGKDALIDFEGMLFTPYSNGIFFSSDTGNNWQSVSSGLTMNNEFNVKCFAAKDSMLFTGTSDGLFRYNSGKWFSVNSGLTSTYVNAIAGFANVLYVGVGGWVLDTVHGDYPSDAGAGIFRSTDDGATWELAGLGGVAVNAIISSDTRLIAGTDNGVFVSPDTGKSWLSASVGFTFSNPDVIYLAVVDTNVFASLSNGYGGIWRRPLSQLMNPNEVTSDTETVFFNDTGIVNVTLNSDSGHFRTHQIDLVNNSSIPLAITNAILTSSNTHFSITQVQPIPPDTVYPAALSSVTVEFFGDTTGTIYRDTIILTLDQGVTHRNNNIPLSESTFLINLTGYSFSPPASVSQMPEDFSSLSSFPNPFSQSTEIAFTSATAGYADVSVVNILGASVAHLFSGELDAGKHDFAWDASTFSPGSYWCVVRIGDSVERIALSVER